MQSDAALFGGSIPPDKSSAPVPGLSGQQPRRIEVNEEDAAAHAEFDRLLADIASRLANSSDGQFDEVVIGCLRTLAEILGFDRCRLMAFSEHGTRLQVTHFWAVAGVPVAPSSTLLEVTIPWFTRQIRSGHIVRVSSSIDLPAEAAKERLYLLQSGLKSVLGIPMLMEGTIFGAITLATFRSQRQWSLGLVSRLRLASEIFALGIRRHQYAQGLRAIAQITDQVSLERGAPGETAAKHFRDRAMRLMQAEHQERRRMAYVLHEDVMQTLAAVSLLVESGEDGIPRSAASVKTVAGLKDALQKLRQLTMELQPVPAFETNLPDGLRYLADQVRRIHDLDVDIHIGDTVGPVHEDIRSFLCDTARKLLENVAVHASCKRATLEIRRSDFNCIELTVSDDGVGFDPASLEDLPIAAFGLSSIREQSELLSGRLEVSSSPGRGTRAVVTVPLSE